MSVRFPAIDSALDPELIRRFRSDLAAIWAGVGPLGIAVSGGSDSLALLLLANAALDGNVEAASVDHQLRPESTAEAEYVAQICRNIGVEHRILTVTVAAGNVQANARAARYLALAQWHDERGMAALATAHHADDQAETLLMRLNRGSGLSGLAGIRAQSVFSPPSIGGEYELLRPLLSWRKSELEQVVSGCGIAPVKDPSNQDDHYDRVRIRMALAGQDWLDIPALAKSAQLLGEAWSDVEWDAASKRSDNVIEENGSYILRFGYGQLFDIEAILWIIEQLGGSATRAEAARLYGRMETHKTASLAGVLVRRHLYETAPDTHTLMWKFEREPARNTG